MKNRQKKKITQNYHLLTKLESGKCRRVTAAIHVICLNCGGIYTNAQIGKQLFRGQKALSVNNVMSRVDASGQRSIERYLTRCFFFQARIIHIDVQCLPSREKKRDVRVLSLPRTRNILVAKKD